MACGTSCCKFLLFSFNLIFALCSLALFLLAVLAQVTISPYYSIGHATEGAPIISLPVLLWIIIAISAFAFFLAFIGCQGAIRESQCMMFCFGSVLAVVIIVELVTIGVGYAAQDQIIEQVESGVNASLPLYFNHSEITRFWDALQTDLKCCGLKGPSDWYEVYKNTTLPDTCCYQLPVGEPCTEEMEAVATEGCASSVIHLLQQKTTIIFIVAALIGIIEIFGVILSCRLGFSISDQYRTV